MTKKMMVPNPGMNTGSSGSNDITGFEEFNKRDIGVTLRGTFVKGSSLKVIIEVDGYLDNVNSTHFMETVAKVIQENASIKTVVIDLLKISYISSTGIGALSNILIQTKKTNIVLYLINVGRKVRSVLDTLGMTGFFNIVDSEEGNAG